MMSPGWAQPHRRLRRDGPRRPHPRPARQLGRAHLTARRREVRQADRRLGAQPGLRARVLPLDSPRGPVVTVVDEHAGSDGDIATAAIKALGLGPVVGTRTWGGVVGIDGRYTLVDGTMVTQPRHAFWLEGYDWASRTTVSIPTSRWCAHRRHRQREDPQLERAIEIALDQLAARPARTAPAMAPR